MSAFQRLLEALGLSKRRLQLVCVGLDNSGKSTIINWLKAEKVGTQKPWRKQPPLSSQVLSRPVV
jgi:ribosome biogenesis GTPase A